MSEESRQQLVLPQVAVNVWDTLTGNHAGQAQHAASVEGADVAQQHGSTLHSWQGGLVSNLGVVGYNSGSRWLEQVRHVAADGVFVCLLNVLTSPRQ